MSTSLIIRHTSLPLPPFPSFSHPANVQFLSDGLGQSRQCLVGCVTWVELVGWPRPLQEEAREGEKRTNQSLELEGVAPLIGTCQPQPIRRHLQNPGKKSKKIVN